MCRIATADDPLFEVCNIELLRSGPSYTIDTVRALQAKWPQREIAWLIGADMLRILPKWHLARELICEAKILVMNRPGFAIDWGALPEPFQALQANVVEAPLIDISATEIRRRIGAGESIEGMVPEGVIRYIRERRLYQ